jgi:hypothetical protein
MNKISRHLHSNKPPHPKRTALFSQSAIILPLLLALLFLTQCSRSTAPLKPSPTPLPREESRPASRWILEVNGRKISPLVPTLFLLPGEPLAIDARPESVLASKDVKAFPPPNGDSRSPATGLYRKAVYPVTSQEPAAVPTASGGESCSVILDGRPMAQNKTCFFAGKAPSEPGFYTLEVATPKLWRKAAYSQEMPEGKSAAELSYSLLVIVLHPFERLEYGFIDQFPMGFFPTPEEPLLKSIPKTLQPLYRPPKGFIPVKPENQATYVSRHFRLQDLDCRVKTPFPHYMALSPELLLKLELLTLKIQRIWGPDARIVVQSGFRTPWHNMAVSGALWSRHIYGDAADIIAALTPSDSLMGDLNGDGRVDQLDAQVLGGLVEEVEKESGLTGGLGLYDWGENRSHGPFVHVDCRGVKARW